MKSRMEKCKLQIEILKYLSLSTFSFCFLHSFSSILISPLYPTSTRRNVVCQKIVEDKPWNGNTRKYRNSSNI